MSRAFVARLMLTGSQSPPARQAESLRFHPGEAVSSQRTARAVTNAISATVRGYRVHGLPQQAAAISFRVLFSFVPLVALTVSVLHLILPADVADRFASWLIGELAGAPELEASVDRASSAGALHRRSRASSPSGR